MPSPHFEPGQSPEEQIERKVSAIITELDELCVMAMNADTSNLVRGQRRSIIIIRRRIDFLTERLIALDSLRVKLRLVSNG